MPRTGGKITRKKILKAAEKLFSDKGFEGASMDDIAAKVGIHKSSIFYYFKSKREIIDTILNNVLSELNSHINSARTQDGNKSPSVLDLIRVEIEFLAGKQPVLKIMLMEALKKGRFNNSLFRCAQRVIAGEHGSADLGPKMLTHEFYTGFLPLVMFVVFRDKWAKFTGGSHNALLETFIQSFNTTHIQTHET